jgi:hypothetical protein
MADGNFKFLLNYVDRGTKFAISIPIVAKRAASVAFSLLNIFTLIGPPAILQSDNGKEFVGHATGGTHLVLGDEVSSFALNLRVWNSFLTKSTPCFSSLMMS